MSNGTDDRIQKILAHKATQKAERAQSKQHSDQQAAELQKRKAAAPAQWAEHWKGFQASCNSINERLSTGGLKIELIDLSRNKGQNDLAMFQVFLHEDGTKSQHFMTCAVADTGNLQITRRLPGLTDSKSIEQSKLNAPTIESFLLLFVENAQGIRTLQQMMNDK